MLVATLVAHALYAGTMAVNAGDMWWTLAAGRYIVEHRTLPHEDVFSYTYAGAPWFNPEWLAQVVYYEVFRSFGGTGLAAFKLVVVAALLLLATWVAWRRSGSLLFACVAAVAAIYVCRPYFDIRAQLFMFVGIVALLAIVEEFRRGGAAWAVALLAVVMLLWVNLHGSFVYGLGVLVLLAGSEISKSRFGLPDRPMPIERARRLAGGVLVAAVACLLNPHGVRALTFPFGLLAEDRQWRLEIFEWQPPVLFEAQPFNPAFFGYFFVAQVLLAVATLLWARRRVDVGDLVLVVVTGAMAFTARRFVPLFALVAIPFMATSLALLRDRVRTRPADAPELSRASGAWAVVILCATSLVLVGSRFVAHARQTFASGLFEGMTGADFFPRGAVEFLRQNPLPGRLFHLYSWGGYLMYWAPDRKVFIDNRGMLVYPMSFFLEQKSVAVGDPAWNDVLDRHGVELVLWPSSGLEGGRLGGLLLQRLRQSPTWQCVYDDAHGAVFAHTTRARSWIEAYQSLTLRYPDVRDAQIFLANAYLRAREFARARQQFETVVRRFPDVQGDLAKLEGRLLEATRTPPGHMGWFGIGFYRDVRGDGAGAADAFRRALETGLTGAEAGYAREALARLPPP